MGEAQRLRDWWAELMAGDGRLPPELVHKLRLIEGVLPWLGRLPGFSELRGCNTVADLLPDDDELAHRFLTMVHDWSAGLLFDPGMCPECGSTVVDDGFADPRVRRCTSCDWVWTQP